MNTAMATQAGPTQMGSGRTAPFAPLTRQDEETLTRQDEETRTALIDWLKAYRDNNRADEVIMAQHTRLDLMRIEGRACLDETLAACEAVQASGLGMIESLRAMTPPAGLPRGDVRAVRLALENSILFYRHQAEWMRHQHGLLTALRPYDGQFAAIPSEEFGEVAPRLYEHLRAIQTCQCLALDALTEATGGLRVVADRWGIMDVVAGFG